MTVFTARLLKSAYLLLFTAGFVSCNSLCPSQPLVQIAVNDTMVKGDIIYQLNGNGTATFSCPQLLVDSNNSVILNVSLRNPCYPEGSFQCNLQCGGMEERFFIINIIKTDLQPPVFNSSVYRASISENAMIGTEIFRISDSTEVIDEDCYHAYNYNLEQADGPFRIGMKSLGNILLNGTINYEDKNKYLLNISVVNNGKKGYASLEIDVTDFDDQNPVFTATEYKLNVTEGSFAKKDLVTEPPVLCFDGDIGINQSVLYSFNGMRNASEYFEIDQDTGILLQLKNIDREQVPFLTLPVKCYQTDKPSLRTASASIVVTVMDVNDHLPVFNPTSYNISLVENAVGYLTVVSVTDQDHGSNADLTFHLSSYEDVFDIESSGIITVKDPDLLDRESKPEIQFEVFAIDRFGNYSENNATVNVILIDVNDNSPNFAEDWYRFFFNHTELGYVVGQINATDVDEPDTGNSEVRYNILSSWSSTVVPVFPLTVDELTGDINVTGPVMPSNQYSMIVQACDNPEDIKNRRCSACRVLAVYTENTTEVLEQTISMEVMENVPLNTMIQVMPVQGDEYKISTNEFTVDEISHALQTLTILDRENISRYEINIEVFSYSRGVIGNISIELDVLDVNDNTPTFTQQQYFFTLPETRTSFNGTIGILQSEDLDAAENGNRTYQFQGIRYSDLFSLDPVAGSIFLLDEFWKSTQTMFPLTAMVSDCGTPSLSTVVPVYISYMTTENNSVRIPAPIRRDQVEKSKESFETGIATILDFSSVTFGKIADATLDVSSARSYVFFTAAASNGTHIPVTELQNSMATHWTTIQELFRQPLSSAASTTKDTLQTAEIALIAVAAVVFIGAFISIYIVCRQWNIHIKHHQLYQHMSRRYTIYDSQEMKMDFGDENFLSRHSTFRGSSHRRSAAESLETSFNGNYINPVFTDDEGNPVKVSTWSGCGTPRIPRWSTSDSIKDAIASLEDLTKRLNSEDNISRVSNMSKSRQSQKSFKPDAEPEYEIPSADYPLHEQKAEKTALVGSDLLDCLNKQNSLAGLQGKTVYENLELIDTDGNIRETVEVSAPNSVEVSVPNSEPNNNKIIVTEVSTAL